MPDQDKNQTDDGIVNQFGMVCPRCLGAGEEAIGPRMDNCQRCGGYRYIYLFWPNRIPDPPPVADADVGTLLAEIDRLRGQIAYLQARIVVLQGCEEPISD